MHMHALKLIMQIISNHLPFIRRTIDKFTPGVVLSIFKGQLASSTAKIRMKRESKGTSQLF